MEPTVISVVIEATKVECKQCKAPITTLDKSLIILLPAKKLTFIFCSTKCASAFLKNKVINIMTRGTDYLKKLGYKSCDTST